MANEDRMEETQLLKSFASQFFQLEMGNGWAEGMGALAGVG